MVCIVIAYGVLSVLRQYVVQLLKRLFFKNEFFNLFKENIGVSYIKTLASLPLAFRENWFKKMA